MKAARRFNWILCGLAALLGAGCAVEPVEEPMQTTAAAEPAAAVAAKAPPPTIRFTAAKGIDAYKAQAAQQIVASSNKTFDGGLPPILKSLVVLDVTIDKRGRPTRVVVSRSNGYRELERTALDSVRRANLPAPQTALLKNGEVRYLETWLFRDDGKFQIRSLVREPQPGSERVALH